MFTCVFMLGFSTFFCLTNTRSSDRQNWVLLNKDVVCSRTKRTDSHSAAIWLVFGAQKCAPHPDQHAPIDMQHNIPDDKRDCVPHNCIRCRLEHVLFVTFNLNNYPQIRWIHGFVARSAFTMRTMIPFQSGGDVGWITLDSTRRAGIFM